MNKRKDQETIKEKISKQSKARLANKKRQYYQTKRETTNKTNRKDQQTIRKHIIKQYETGLVDIKDKRSKEEETKLANSRT